MASGPQFQVELGRTAKERIGDAPQAIKRALSRFVDTALKRRPEAVGQPIPGTPFRKLLIDGWWLTYQVDSDLMLVTLVDFVIRNEFEDELQKR